MANAFTSILGNRVEWSTSTAWLALGDIVVLVGLLSVGSLRHGIDPFAQPLHIAETVAPFLLGWLIAAPLVGAYAPNVFQSQRMNIGLTIAAWVPAVVIGATLRATSYFQGNSPLTFVAVTLGFGTVFLGVWRALAIRLLPS